MWTSTTVNYESEVMNRIAKNEGEVARKFRVEVRHTPRSRWNEGKDISSRTTVVEQYVDMGNPIGLKCDECGQELEGVIQSTEFLNSQKKIKNAINRKIRLILLAIIIGAYLVFSLREAIKQNEGNSNAVIFDFLLIATIGLVIILLFAEPILNLISLQIILLLSYYSPSFKFDKALIKLKGSNVASHSLIYYSYAKETQGSEKKSQ